MVRLRGCNGNRSRSFNAISIPVWYDWELCISSACLIMYPNFNSSMVRLRDWSIAPNCNSQRRFQFQYGTIERLLELFIFTEHCLFQFQYGTIESQFGSIDRPESFVFQFQYGTIERFFVFWRLGMFFYFNSSMVRLRGLNFHLWGRFASISIPVWYDWELTHI